MRIGNQVNPADPVNRAILSVSEDRLEGFHSDPIGEIARMSGIPANTVIERLRLMLRTGVVRRIRQTSLTHHLAEGGLIAWRLPENKISHAFEFMVREDPFSGHVVIREAESPGPGTDFRLWTTLKVPQTSSLERHCGYLQSRTGAFEYRLMPARAVFVLSVGHTRRLDTPPGTRADDLPEVSYPSRADLSAKEWQVLLALTRELTEEEITRDIWRGRALGLEMTVTEFLDVARGLADRNLLGRFATFLDHAGDSPQVRKLGRSNALLLWATPQGREVSSGQQIGRHTVLTHCYWRDAGPEFGGVNIMGVVHGSGRDSVRAHKDAIDRNLAEAGIDVSYSNILWSERSAIKPSELSVEAYRDWCAQAGISG